MARMAMLSVMMLVMMMTRATREAASSGQIQKSQSWEIGLTAMCLDWAKMAIPVERAGFSPEQVMG